MSERKTNKLIYYLMLVTEDENGNIVERDVDENEWKKLKNIPQEIKEIILSDELVQRIILIQERFRLNDSVVGKINVLLRHLFFGEMSLSECEAKIGSMLAQTGSGDPNQARAIVEFIQNEILTIQPKPKTEETQETEYEEEKPKATAVNLPLLQALSKYEQLGQQVITSEKIKLKTQIELVRPSLVNWLKYYRDELGIGQHSSVERGEFLFRSENGRKLSAEERERISLILKSVEEYLPITIDTERQKIIFPKFQGVALNNSAAVAPAFPSIAPNKEGFGRPPLMPARNNAGGVSFSSGHTLPAEKEELSSFRIKPMTNKE